MAKKEQTEEKLAPTLKKATVDIPEKGKIKIQAYLAPGVFLGDFKGCPVNVTVARNLCELVTLGAEVEVTFKDVIEGAAVEANYRPEVPASWPNSGKK